MKTMTCSQLGGACEKAFTGDTFEELAEQAKQHGMQMFQQGDAEHLKAIQKMQSIMTDPEGMQKWFAGKKEEFKALPND